MTATARGGSYLNCQIHSANSHINVASDPFLGVFKSLRNAILRDAGTDNLNGNRLEESPLHNYFFLNEGSSNVDAVNKGSLLLDCPDSNWEELVESMKPRVAHQCAELLPFLDRLRDKNYKDIIDNSIDVIRQARNLPDMKWIGIKEAWVIQLFLPLARAYPEAKFIVVVRDIRASIASNILLKKKSMIAHVASFVKGWRKNIAYTSFLKSHPLMKDRFYVISYEKMLSNRTGEAQKVCNFLDVDCEPGMLDTENFIDYSTRKTWVGNSSYETVTNGISPHRIDRWKETLAEDAQCAVELLAGPDLPLIGRAHVNDLRDPANLDKAICFLVSDNDGYKDWRTDSENPYLDFSREVTRNAMLSLKSGTMPEQEIRKNFLFEESYQDLLTQRDLTD